MSDEEVAKLRKELDGIKVGAPGSPGIGEGLAGLPARLPQGHGLII
jgi:hypothetical protein